MAKKKLTDSELLAIYTRRSVYLQKLASQYANDIVDILNSNERGLKTALNKQILLLTEGKSSIKKLRKLLKKFRSPGLQEAEKMLNEQLGLLALQEGDFAERSVSAATGEAIATSGIGIPADSRYGPDGVRGLFEGLDRNVNDSIVSKVRAGLSKRLAGAAIAKSILPEVDGNINSATTIARTTVNAVANDTRMEIYKNNADVIKWLVYSATLDSRTSAICAALDGTRWKYPQEEAEVRVPPLHPNCRSVIRPLVTDEDHGSRPSAQADFEKLGRELHAKSKSKVPYDELSKGSKLNWRYKAIADYRKNVGAPYKTVQASTDFEKFLANSSNEFQKDYLGPARYELYKSGKFPIDRFVNIDTGEKLSLADLERRYRKDFESVMGKDN